MVCSVIGLIMAILSMFLTGYFWFLLFCWIGLILTCIYTIFDVYLITEKHGLEYDDYIIGALLLYIDLVTIFIYILEICGNRE